MKGWAIKQNGSNDRFHTRQRVQHFLHRSDHSVCNLVNPYLHKGGASYLYEDVAEFIEVAGQVDRKNAPDYRINPLLQY
jgi:hypothetical protein